MSTKEVIAHPVESSRKVASVGSRQIRHLSQPIILEEMGAPRLVSAAIFIVTAITAAFIAWAYFVEIDETSVAYGQIIPSGDVRVIQHLEGGIVREISVHEGDLVKQGDIVARLDPVEASSDADRLKARRTALLISAERLRAIGEDRMPEFSGFDQEKYGNLIADNREVYRVQAMALDAKADVLKKQLLQAENEISVMQTQQAGLEEQRKIVDERAQRSTALLDKRLIGRDEYLASMQDLERLDAEIRKIKGDQVTAREKIAETEKRLIDLVASRREQAYNEMATVTDELVEIEQTLKKLTDRVDRLYVAAPVAGRVQDMRINTIGSVIPAGGVLMKIVPVDETLIAEVRISPQDIGHISEGQKVTLKVNAYDFSRYGSVDGELTYISPTTFVMSDKDIPYYKGRIRLDADHVGKRTDTKLQPGMTLQADIITGHKTLLQYLLKPVYVSLSLAFHER